MNNKITIIIIIVLLIMGVTLAIYNFKKYNIALTGLGSKTEEVSLITEDPQEINNSEKSHLAPIVINKFKFQHSLI